MTNDEIKKRIEEAARLRSQSSAVQRISESVDGAITLKDTAILRDRHEIKKNLKRKKEAKNAVKGLAKHHESGKNNRFARDGDFGQ